VPIDANLRPEEISYLLGHSRLRSLFVSPAMTDVARKLGSDLRLFVLGGDQNDAWRQLITSEPLEPFATANEQAVLIYTSGTTGAPKAVMLTHKNLLSNARDIAAATNIGQTDRFLSVLPLHHTFEATAGFLLPALTGASVTYARSLKSRDIIEDAKRTKATCMIGVPLLFEKMKQAFEKKLAQAPWQRRAAFRLLYGLSRVGWKLDRRWGKPLFHPVRRRAGLGTVRMFCSGGAPLPPPISEYFNLIGFELVQGYGMTETSPAISVQRPGDVHFGSVGQPIGEVQVRIDRPDTDGIGEIIVRGDNVTPGYHDNPEATAELIRDGWLHTGDLGRWRRGHLWITGRRKNVIVSAAGKNIYPEELEEKLLESDLVLEAIVFGRARTGRQGEDVHALIVPDMELLAGRHSLATTEMDLSQITPLIKTVVDEVNQRVADYKRISGFEIRTEELEKNSTRKVKRFLYR
jgi:long-chain acyl-CoA synthetase